jgi:hypothetical protein
MSPDVPPGVEFRVNDWLTVANEYESEAALVHLDPNWAAPARYSGRGVDYVTHPITENAIDDFPAAELERDEIDTSRNITDGSALSAFLLFDS